MNEALLLELEYLKENLAEFVGDKSNLALFHNSYAVLTACRIFYTAKNAALVSKDIASVWTLENIPQKWHTIVNTARENRLAGKGLKTKQLETDAMDFVCFIERRVGNLL